MSWFALGLGVLLREIDSGLLGGSAKRVMDNALAKHHGTLGEEGVAFARAAYTELYAQSGDAKASALKAVALAYEERNRQPEPVPDIHGSARLARISELAQAGLLGGDEEIADACDRLWLGKLAMAENDQADKSVAPEVFWSGEGPMLTVAPTRAGKGMSQIIPNLLRYVGSIIVMDPKGENYRLTAGCRHYEGSRVFKLDPFNLLNERKPPDDPVDYGETDAFNPLDYIRSESDARTLATLLHPPVPAGHHAAAKFFSDEAINFLTAVILYVVQSAPRKNLAEVRRVTTLDASDQKSFLEAMARSDNPVIASEGKLALQKPRDKRIELFRSLNAELAPWSEKGLQAATARSDFDFRSLKDGPVTVYVIVALEQMEAYSSFIRIVFTTAISAMLQSQRNLPFPVLFLMDEFPSMGPQDKIVESASFLSGFDVRLWIVTQTLKRLADTYPTKWEDLVEQSAVKMFLNPRAGTAELISRWMGLSTVAYETRSSGFSASISSSHDLLGGGTASLGKSQSSGVAYTGRPLMMPDEVEELFGRAYGDAPELGIYTACFLEGQRPFAVQRPYWFLSPWLTALVEDGRRHIEAWGTARFGETYDGPD